MNTKQEILVNLSANIHIKSLMDKNYTFTMNNQLGESVLENLWILINQYPKIETLTDFYSAIITFSTKKIQQLLSDSELPYPVDILIRNIMDYYGTNIATMSDKIIEKGYENYLSSTGQEKNEKSLVAFFYLLKDDENTFFSLINSFPLWKRNILHFLDTTTIYLEQVFAKLEADFVEIKKMFCTGELSIMNIHLDQGDRHHDSFVVRFETDCGNLFYKPRSNQVDKVFVSIFEKIRDNTSGLLDIKSSSSFGRATYSWIRGVSYNGISNRGEEERYYLRMGQMLAMFYILNGNDIHYENLISVGEYPVPIDVETLFSSKLFLNKNENSMFLSEIEVNYSATSVRNIGIIPSYIRINEDSIDISSINIEEKFDNPGVEQRSKKHLHAAGKLYLSMEDIEETIVKGFKNLYWGFVNNMDNIVPEIKKIVNGLEIRFLNHMTAEYALIKNSIMKPICFYNPKYAYAISTRIFISKEEPTLVELYEQEELLNLNIPYFKVNINERNLILSNNNQIKLYFRKSPWQLFEEKIKFLGNKDFDYQITTINKMFTARKGIDLCEVKDFLSSMKEDEILPTDMSRDILRSACKDILDDIASSSIISEVNNEHMWIEYQLSGEKYEVVNVPNNYYSGLFGVIKVLIESTNLYSKNYIMVYVNEAISIINKVTNLDISGMLTGAYDGIGEYINFLRDTVNLGIIDQHDYESNMKKLLSKCLEIYSDDTKFDVLNGNAGLLLSLLHALEGANSIELKDFICKVLSDVKDEVLSNIYSKDNKKSFPVDGRTNTYFNGFAHGSAGIVVALYKAMKQLDCEDKEIIEKLLDTQRLHFNSNEGIWYNDNKHTKFSWGWCHGIPGILLSRLELLRAGYKDKIIEKEITTLFELSLNKALGANTTFCHGDMAIITILELALNMGFCNINQLKVENYKASLISNVLLNWRTKAVRGMEVVGMMDGLAGIAYFLLCTAEGKSPLGVLTITEGGVNNA